MNGGPSQSARVLIDTFESKPIKLDALNRYWSDPEYRAQVEVEREAGQRRINKSIDEAKDRAGVRWPSHWTEKEKYEAGVHWSGGDQ